MPPHEQSQQDTHWASSPAVDIDPSSYIDPNGFVFWKEGIVYRVIRPEVQSFYRGLFEDGTIRQLEAASSLVHSEITELAPPTLQAGMVLRHETIWPRSYCVEWCPSMLRDAALATLDLSLAIVDRGYYLQDAYPWNVLFRGSEPVYVDFTSIVPAQPCWLWPAYGQFEAFFLRPLQLAALGKGRLARALLLDNIAGISLGEFFTHATPAFKFTHPALMLTNRLDHLVQRSVRLKSLIKRGLARYRLAVSDDVRQRFYLNARRRVTRLRFTTPKETWASYYETLPSHAKQEVKREMVSKIINQLRPQTVLDLGANTGQFSILAAKAGARVVAIDASEACIERLYHTAKAERLPITPLIADVLCPTPAFGFLGEQYLPLFARVRSELVLCLGLMHHLHIAGRQSFDRIAEMLRTLATQHLIFEYVDYTDENVDKIASARAINYTVASVKEALGKCFRRVEVYASDRPTRNILLCSHA